MSSPLTDGVIRCGRRALADLLAHLGEVEERRLHLRAAFPSLFSYCVTRLGFSEDEACRRIDVELARDLMRHANPSGDFAPILSRALDLLIADVEKRRFGARSKRTSAKSRPASKLAPASSPYVPRSTRRNVAARDGLRCCWTDDTGRRCNSRAWLEHDHEVPRGKGGGSEEGNVRSLCRAHNRLEAERQFGRQHVAHAIARARDARRKRRDERASEARVVPGG
jgi:hypothetical protein